MIKIRNVSYAYKEEDVLHDISFDIGEGEFVGIIGPNGSGKTTLLRLMAGYLEPMNGAVLLRDKNIVRYPKKYRARQIAVVSQYYMVNQYHTVQHLVQIGREPHLSFFKRLAKEDNDLIDHVLNRLDLFDFKSRVVRTLSGGELQRVLLAKALVQNTPIMLMDEPTNHLDVHHQIKVLNILREYKRAGKTIVTVFHDLNFAARYSDRIVVLDKKLISEGKPAEVLTKEMLKDVFKTEDFEISRDMRVVLK